MYEGIYILILIFLIVVFRNPLYTLSDYVIDLLNVILNLYAVMLQYVCAIVM